MLGRRKQVKYGICADKWTSGLIEHCNMQYQNHEKREKGKDLLLKPSLCKVPDCNGSMHGSIGCKPRIMTTARANIECGILLRHMISEIIYDRGLGIFGGRCSQIDRDIVQSVVGEANLIRLVNVEDIDFVVPMFDVKLRHPYRGGEGIIAP